MNITNKQRIGLSILCFALAVASLLGAGAVFSQRLVRMHGTLNGLPPQSLAERPPILGVNVELRQYDDDEELEENLSLISDTGFVWVRQVFDWSEIEDASGEYDWSEYDRLVEASAAHDLKLAAVLWLSPDWAADNPTAPPEDLDDFRAFSSELAKRYGDRIDVYQIWDEPNLSAGWGGMEPNVVEYAALLEAGYNAIHEADPDATVLTAGLAPTIETGPQNLSDVLFLRALYENGAANLFDGVAGKPYGFDNGPDDRQVNQNVLNFSRFVLLREEMVNAGDGNKLLWASHFGWNALPEGWEGEPSVWGLATPELQAERTSAAYERALEEWPWAGVMFVENWQPDAPPDSNRWGFALRSRDGELSALVEALSKNADLYTEALWSGRYEAATPLVDYDGDWEFGDLGADIVENGESIVTVPFAGDTLAIITRRDNYRAYLYVDVNGQPSPLLPHDERGAYLVLTSPDYMPRVESIPIAENTGGVSEVRIEAERGWDQWALAGYAVGNRVDTTSFDVLIGLFAALAVGLFGVSAWMSQPLARGSILSDAAAWLMQKLGDTLHLILSFAAASAVWVGAALTWGGAVPMILRKLGDGVPIILTALTAGVFYFSPWLILTIIALAVLFVLIYAKPSTGVALMVFFAPYYLLPRPLFDRAFTIVEVVSLLTAVVWVLHMISERKEKGWPTVPQLWASMTMLDKALALFIGLAIISLTWADLPGVAGTELRQMVLEPFVVYLVMRTIPMTRKERWQIVDVLILTGVVVSVIGMYQVATGIDVITAEAGTRRLKSIFGTPNNAALFLGRLVPMTAAIAFLGSVTRRRVFYGAAGVIMLSATVLTLSRGALLLGIPAGLAVVAIFWLGRRGVYLVIAGVILEVLALIPLTRNPRFAELLDFSSETSTSLFRVQLWQSTFRMLRDHPITGLGLDQFLYAYRGYYILPEAWRQPDLSQPHNFLLNYWVRLGIFGLIAGIWIQVAFWKMGLHVQKVLRERDRSSWALSVGLLGAMGAFMAHGMVDEVHFVIDLAFVFYMMLGLMHQLNANLDAGDQ